MGVSLQEVIESAGYDLSTVDDARWLLSQVNQFEELVIKAEDMIEQIEEAELNASEENYRKVFGE